ncbi:GAF domain-containing protein [Aestuariibacter salexigens]|uniref:GAF domain-containing protein n=1 Tax=Aestuariibacter salexigens TaxID=226010 RepID=UPI0004234312|nr:GAF domain-containing protein [Aestuariibacter salexigens]
MDTGAVIEPTTNKAELYQQILEQVKAITFDETDAVANMANISAVLFHAMPDINWAGFYLYKQQQLILGPFQGKPACIRIAMGKGVCGTAAELMTIQRIENVHEFKGHIACDSASNSEIVIPVTLNGELYGVLDIDSPQFARFDDVDQHGLTAVVKHFESTLS